MFEFFFKVLYKQKFNVFDLDIEFITLVRKVFIKKKVYLSYLYVCFALPKIYENSVIV